MSTLIHQIKEERDAKQIDTSTAFGKTWLLQKMAKVRVRPQDRLDIIREREAHKSKSLLGRFYFFMYAPKLKEVLPWWDQFPMVIVLNRFHDGFLGLNLHYIYPKDRLILLHQLRACATGPLTDERTRLRLSYPILKAMHRAYRATPCIKRYLNMHIMSRCVEVPANEWDIAATLPAQRFTGKIITRNEEVWRDSKEKY